MEEEKDNKKTKKKGPNFLIEDIPKKLVEPNKPEILQQIPEGLPQMSLAPSNSAGPPDLQRSRYPWLSGEYNYNNPYVPRSGNASLNEEFRDLSPHTNLVQFIPDKSQSYAQDVTDEGGESQLEGVKYRLRSDGDVIEREAWGLFLEKHFPNYERFWLYFVVPRTNRDRERSDIRIKDGIEYDDRKIMMLHYSILVHFYYIYKDLKNAYKQESFEHMYIRLSAITDICEEFLLRVLLWECKGTFRDSLKTLLGISELEKSMRKRIKRIEKIKEGKLNDILKALDDGRNYAPPIMTKKRILTLLLEMNLSNKLNSSFKLIRDYRNFIVHSWTMFKINHRFPRKEFVSKTRDWVPIYTELMDESKVRALVETKYADMAEMITTDFYELLNLLNETWKRILKKRYLRMWKINE
ncbi:MAG: hypothetical protein ACTSRS_07675 [Candidatus Helarchaeota archaeon]